MFDCFDIKLYLWLISKEIYLPLFFIFLGKRPDLPLLVDIFPFLLVLAPTFAGSFIGQPDFLLQEVDKKETHSRKELHKRSSFNFFISKINLIK